MRRAIFAFVMALGGVGCDRIISSDVTETPFDLPPRTYSFDASSLGIPAGITSEVPCGAGQVVTDCCAPPSGFPMPDCGTTPLTCEQNENGVNVCTAMVMVSQNQTINFGQEVPELSGLPNVLDIKIKRISYEVIANTLTVDLPDVDLSLSNASHPTPTKFGTMPAIPAQTTRTGDVLLEGNAEAVLGSVTEDLSAPVTLTTSTTLRVTRTPTGRIDIRVSGELAASL